MASSMALASLYFGVHCQLNHDRRYGSDWAFGRFFSYGMRGFLAICWIQGLSGRKLGSAPDSSLIHYVTDAVTTEASDLIPKPPSLPNTVKTSIAVFL